MCFLSTALTASISSPAHASDADPAGTRPVAPGLNAVGAVAGTPQFLGVSYERILGSEFALDVHAGTMILLTGYGARISWGSVSEGFRPRLSFGLAAIDVTHVEDFGGTDGTAVYSWPGAGLAWRTRGFTTLLDAGWLFTDNDEDGLGQLSFPAVSLAIMARF
jgi:hypothetical protein